MDTTKQTKVALAKKLGIARSSLYYKPKRTASDEELRRKVVSVMTEHPAYGHRRIAMALELNKKSISRIMKKHVQSKYYVDALSENTKRGLRQKVRRGEFPGTAPLGYQNDVRIKSIVVDRKRSVIVRKAFEMYAENKSRLEDISDFLADHGVVSSGGNKRSRDQMSFLLSNPFYYGYFKYGGELHEGKHPPIITKKLFDKVQWVLKERSHPGHTVTEEPRVLCGLLRCGTCQMMITGEKRVKKQQNGKTHTYTYYHCSKKSKKIACDEPCIREEELDEQISKLVRQHFLPPDWAKELLVMIEKDVKEGSASQSTLTETTRTSVREIKLRLERLLDTFLDQDIEREAYLEKKADLMSQKKSLEEKTSRLGREQLAWVEPMQKWIEQAQNMENIAQDHNLFAKKVAAKEIFGSNLLLTQKNVVVGSPQNVVAENVVNVVDPSENVVVIEKNVVENVVGGGVKRHWVALQAINILVNERPRREAWPFLAPRLGFEPRYTAPEAVVLPLDDLGISSKSVCQQPLNVNNLE